MCDRHIIQKSSLSGKRFVQHLYRRCGMYAQTGIKQILIITCSVELVEVLAGKLRQIKETTTIRINKN